MKHVRKSVLLWYSPAEMYGLVTDVEAYPRFLPWCEQAEVLERSDSGMVARLHLGYKGVHHAFTTRNEHVVDREVAIGLIDGPFSVLDGIWRFVPLQAPSGDETACRVELDLSYAFSGPALEALLSPVFDRIANTLVDSFVKRAEQVHGPR
jgi:ribosome-associated toxin RatA of RatAB toxin-antitoxin module